ncbi:cobyrinate a,c-diamide synthase [Magnetospira sp. QH-2]|uniref:cobyrinate a,c-diamide synthase n=1 Tax=Magnetospira sp. (strain QH-2) TaxID=1288970 RepID=UPI0003E814FB|nr:cobyrinate a,c-diamide synthase [Magnetospira sp. QH-2]CCQ75571.1 Cobyrinic acid A,C-diamide synthase [Magnetospira sp. QH-2]
MTSGSLPGLIVAAPSSGSGKTLLTLGLLRHFSRSGIAVASAKCGPDYIDPAFHSAATGRPCPTLDPWAMRPGTLAASLPMQADLLIAEGVMGLFDGATASSGSTADLAALTGWPVVLVVDARAQTGSAAAVVRGFASHRTDVTIAGVIFNRVGSATHEAHLRAAMALHLPHMPILGCLPRADALALPSRHLGLVQAAEHADLPAFLDGAADLVAAHLDLAALRGLARIPVLPRTPFSAPLPPLGQHIAVARDEAFAFTYPHLLEGWRHAGATLSFFSPLADDSPDPQADAVYLPGGYPELHAGRLAANGIFLDGLRAAAARQAFLFGECGGYMVLGKSLTDKDGRAHAMAGLLPLETSFAQRRLHLGYRAATLRTETPLGTSGTMLRGHEFHYATIVAETGGSPLFHCRDARNTDLGSAGLREGSVAGSFIHLIDRE